MKKMFLLGFAVFGISTFASAWVRTTPQVWNGGGWDGANSKVTVSCYNQQQNPCMGGNTTHPVPGQQVAIYDPFGNIVARGVLLNSTEPDPPGDGTPPYDVESIFDVRIEEVMGELPN